MAKYNSIHDYVVAMENAYSLPVNINGWDWSMKEHIKTSFFYHHGRLLNGNDEDTPVKNITRPLLNLQFHAENVDVKDSLLYVDQPDKYHLSFLVKRYHDDVFIVENDMDTFFDELVESKVVYGGALIKKMEGSRPMVVPLQSIVFCDQTNLLGAPIGFSLFLNPDELKEMAEYGWGKESNGANVSIDELIALADSNKVFDEKTGQYVESTTKSIKVIEIHGCLPPFAEDGEKYGNYEYQFAIVAEYQDKTGATKGVTLFRSKQKKGNLKFLARDTIYSRALGFGGAEELFESQVWSNYSVIRQKDFLDATSKVILQTTDPTLASRHPSGLKNLDNLEVIEIQQGANLAQVDTTPRSFAIFDSFEKGMKEHAQFTASAFDAQLGQSPTAGTPFKLQELVVTEGKSIHKYRQGKTAKFIEEIYRDWIIPEITKSITKGKEFLSQLSMDEMVYVSDTVARNLTNSYVKEKILSGELLDKAEVDAYEKKVKQDFLKSGNKKFIKILAGEFTKAKLAVKINVAGKQKNLAAMTDKLVNIFRQIFADPQRFQQAMQVPGMSKTWNEILEYSGLTPGDFTTDYNPQPQEQLQSPIQGQQPQLSLNQQ